jgi:hypothetical protein
MQWRKPQIETIFSVVPGEIIGADAVVAEHVATIYEDLRPGREGRKFNIMNLTGQSFGR